MADKRTLTRTHGHKVHTQQCLDICTFTCTSWKWANELSFYSFLARSLPSHFFAIENRKIVNAHCHVESQICKHVFSVSLFILHNFILNRY